MKLPLKIILIAALSLIINGRLFCYPAVDVEPLDNREYFPQIHNLLSSAKKSIRIIMFSAIYYENKSNSPTNQLINDLMSARKRGVTVEVILEKTGNKRDDNINQKNNVVKSLLEREKVLVYNDDPRVTTHSKLIIIDDYITIIGSTNWSFSAITLNNETAVAIYSNKLAKHYIEYFNAIKKR